MKDTVSESPSRTIGNMWTAKKPYADGFYWIKSVAITPESFTIIRVADGLASCIDFDFLISVDTLHDNLLFSGPIRPPE